MATQQVVSAVAPHEFVLPLTGPGWLCGQCKQPSGAPVHQVGG